MYNKPLRWGFFWVVVLKKMAALCCCVSERKGKKIFESMYGLCMCVGGLICIMFDSVPAMVEIQRLCERDALLLYGAGAGGVSCDSHHHHHISSLAVSFLFPLSAFFSLCISPASYQTLLLSIISPASVSSPCFISTFVFMYVFCLLNDS